MIWEYHYFRKHPYSILLETSWKHLVMCPTKRGRMKSFICIITCLREFVSIQYSTDLFKPYFWVNHFCGRWIHLVNIFNLLALSLHNHQLSHQQLWLIGLASCCCMISWNDIYIWMTYIYIDDIHFDIKITIYSNRISPPRKPMPRYSLPAQPGCCRALSSSQVGRSRGVVLGATGAGFSTTS